METVLETTHNLLDILDRYSTSKESFVIRKRQKAAKKAAKVIDQDTEEATVQDDFEDEESVSQKIVERKFKFGSIESVPYFG